MAHSLHLAAFSDLVAAESYRPSPYQADVLAWAEANPRSALVGAVAGSGKSSTLEMVCRYVRYLGTNGVRLPSGTAASEAKIHAVAFNNTIARELTPRLKPHGASVSTMHSHAYAALRNGWMGRRPWLPDKYAKAWDRKPYYIAQGIIGELPGDPGHARAKLARKSLSAMYDLVRQSLTDLGDARAISDLAAHHNVDAVELTSPGAAEPRTVLELVPLMVEEGDRIFEETGEIDFTDMLWQPVRLGLGFPRFDIFLVDECQDLSGLQREVFTRSIAENGRGLAVGDKKQAIYGFSGADAESYERIATDLDAVRLPLSTTYRCARRIVQLAQVLVPTIQAASGAPQGTVDQIDPEALAGAVAKGDLVVGRLNAPLIRYTIQLIGRRIDARMKGRDIGRQIAKVIEEAATIEGFDFDRIQESISTWEKAELEKLIKRDAPDSTLDMVRDKAEGARVIAQAYPEARTVPQLVEAIMALFADDEADVWLSSVHRAKGLEADRVFIVSGDRMPLVRDDQRDWEYQQEINCLYVAITRPKTHLTFAGPVPGPIAGAFYELTTPLAAPQIAAGSAPDPNLTTETEAPQRATTATTGGAPTPAAFRQRTLEL